MEMYRTVNQFARSFAEILRSILRQHAVWILMLIVVLMGPLFIGAYQPQHARIGRWRPLVYALPSELP